MIDGTYSLIDFHCHIYPEKIAERAVEGTDTFYGLHSECKGTAEDLLEKGVKDGVDHFLVQSVATTPKQVASINEFIANEVEKSEGRFSGFGTLHPDSADLKSDFEHLKALGLKGVKLHPDIQRFKIDDYRCLKIYELCERDNIPILMHTGDRRFDFSNPNRMLPIMEIYTDLIVIGAHLGGWSVWDEAADKLSKFPNFYVDTSSSLRFMSRKKAKGLIRKWGADKVLFGTDYPMWSVKPELDAIFELGLDESEYQCILNMNAKKILNLE